MPTITGTTGDDTLLGSPGDDVIDGVRGRDVIYGGDGDDVIHDGDTHDDVLAGTARDQVYGGAGNDVIHDGDGFDDLDGGSGDDLFILDRDTSASPRMPPPGNAIVGGTGFDTTEVRGGNLNIVYDRDLQAFRSAGAGTSIVASAVSIERFAGVDVGMQIDATGLQTRIELLGGAGADYLTGGDAADLLRGGDGDDQLTLGSGDQQFGDGGDDLFVWGDYRDGLASSTRVEGGTGSDTLRVSEFNGNQTINLSGGQLGGLRFAGIENLDIRFHNPVGASQPLFGVINGDADDNVITVSGNFEMGGVTVDGGGGDDIIVSTHGAATLYGGAGNDQLMGYRLADSLYGGAGDDILSLTLGGDVLDGGSGNDTLLQHDGYGRETSLVTGVSRVIGVQTGDYGYGDTATITGFENVTGNSGDDRITGDDGANILRGMGGNDVIHGGAGNDRIEGGLGLDTLYGEEGDDVFIGADNIDGGEGFDTLVIDGSFFDVSILKEDGVTVLDFGTSRTTLTGVERIVFSDGVVNAYPDGFFLPTRVALGTGGDDDLYGLPGPDHLIGGAGDDRLYGNIGMDLLDGGAGYDVAEYDGARREYEATSTYVTGGPEGGTDRLISIEALQFTDGVLTFDPDSLAAKIMRLYDAALDRAPDQRGFEDLLDYLEGGGTYEALAGAFITSPEFQDRFGDLSDEAYVDAMYRFSLDRAPDPDGFQFWVDQLEAGMTRQDLLIAFSECPEHRQLTQPRLDQGLWVADDDALKIARLYDTAFDRLPDSHGLSAWTNQLEGGHSLVDLAAIFIASQEFIDLFGEMTNQEFVELMYRTALDREGDTQGVADWTAQLNGGMSRAAVMVAFSECAEHVALTRDVWLGGVQLAGMTPDDDAFILPTWDDGMAAEVLPMLDDADIAPATGLHEGLAFLDLAPRPDHMMFDGVDLARPHDDRPDHDWMM